MYDSPRQPVSATPALGFAQTSAFRLSQLGAFSAARFAAYLEGLGVTPREFAVLSHLAANDGCTQRQLADTLGLHPNTIVTLIDEMEARSWVRRERSTADRRAFGLRVTRSGQHVISHVNDVAESVTRDVVGSLSRTDQEALDRLLQSLVTELGISPTVHLHVATGAPPRRRRGS